MKTVNMKDDVFARAEQVAEERGVTVDEFVSDLVAQATMRPTDPETSEAHRARMKLVELARNSHRGMIGEWNREDAYAERLSRYERSGLRSDRGKDASDVMEEGNGNPRSE